MNAITERWLKLQVNDADLEKLASALDLKLITDYLTHAEEKNNSIRDQWGNWDIQYNSRDHREPFLDFSVNKALQELQIPKRKLWPGNAKFAAVFSHDMDMVSENDPAQIVRRFNRVLPQMKGKLQRSITHLKVLKYKLKERFSQHKNDPLWHHERWIDEAKDSGMKNTFFVYVNPNTKNLHLFDCDYNLSDFIMYRGERITVAGFLKKAKAEGVEIGLHGSYNSYNDKELFHELQSQLEQAIDDKVVVTRQHYLKYDINKTPDVHKDNGIFVDSTLGYNRGIGFRAGTAFPYFLESGVLELPMIAMDGAFFRDNSLEFNEEYTRKVIVRLFDDVEESGGCITFNFHQNYVNVPLYWNTYKFALVEAKKRNAWPTSLQEIHQLVNTIS